MGTNIIYLQTIEGSLEYSGRGINSRKGEGKYIDRYGVDKFEECFYDELWGNQKENIKGKDRKVGGEK